LTHLNLATSFGEAVKPSKGIGHTDKRSGSGNALLDSKIEQVSLVGEEKPLSNEQSSSKTGATGDRTELEDLFLSNMPQFYRAAARMLQNPQDSEDALQNGLLSAFLHLDQFQGRSSLSTWVHSIVTNAARMQLRKRSRLRTTSIADDIVDEDGWRSDDVLIDSKPSPEEECAREERSQMLRERMRHLSPAYRSVVQMCIIEGLLRREAAQKLGVPAGTVKARLHRACALLAKRAQV